MGYTFFPKIDEIYAIVNPTITDDEGLGYEAGSVWVNTVLESAYLCIDSTVGAAVWDLVNYKSRAKNVGIVGNISVIGNRSTMTAKGSQTTFNAYDFFEHHTNFILRGAVSVFPDGAGGFSYAVNRRALLPPFDSTAVTAAIDLFIEETGVVPAYLSDYGQSEHAATKHLVDYGSGIVYVANLFRDYTTGTRKVMYSVENNSGATTTIMNAMLFSETSPNVWNLVPVISPQLVPLFGMPVRISMQNHFISTFNI